MKKAEVDLLVAQLVECGKGLALASLMEEGQVKKLSENLLKERIDEICKEFNLQCSDLDFTEAKEILEDGKQG